MVNNGIESYKFWTIISKFFVKSTKKFRNFATAEFKN